jgi:hypothetical protein
VSRAGCETTVSRLRVSAVSGLIPDRPLCRGSSTVERVAATWASAPSQTSQQVRLLPPALCRGSSKNVAWSVRCTEPSERQDERCYVARPLTELCRFNSCTRLSWPRSPKLRSAETAYTFRSRVDTAARGRHGGGWHEHGRGAARGTRGFCRSGWGDSLYSRGSNPRVAVCGRSIVAVRQA